MNKKIDARLEHYYFAFVWCILIIGPNKKPCKSLFFRAFVHSEVLTGDPAGTRTQGPYIKSVLLYQLSYEINLHPNFNKWIPVL